MSESEIILEYNGPVDLTVIESLLGKLKKTKEFTSLNKITGKRTYGIVVECLENIYKHSALKSSNDNKMQPHIAVRKENDRITIVAGNPVSYDIKDKLIRRLDQLNQSDKVALQTMHENRINRDMKPGENGAGLGFIYIALKSGNKISYSFRPLNKGYIYFEITIFLNENIMRKLIIEKTSSSPQVVFDPENNIYQISGESRPSDVREFYDQIILWLEEFSIYLSEKENITDPLTFNFNFEYFNSSSGKLILDICKILAGLRARGININLNWHFEKDDVDMLEVGKEMSKIVKFPFEFVEQM